MSGIGETFDRIDGLIGNIRGEVDTYSRNVEQLSGLHNIIIKNAADAEDTILFLRRLADALIKEIQVVVENTDDTTVEIERLNDEIAARQETINELSGQINQYQGAISELQRRADAQYANLDAINTAMGDTNNTFQNTAQKLNDFNIRLHQLQERRRLDVTNLQNQIQARGSIMNELQDLDRQRAELQQMLLAIETLPEQDVINARPTGPGSRGGPGSRVAFGINRDNIMDTRLR